MEKKNNISKRSFTKSRKYLFFKIYYLDLYLCFQLNISTRSVMLEARSCDELSQRDGYIYTWPRVHKAITESYLLLLTPSQLQTPLIGTLLLAASNYTYYSSGVNYRYHSLYLSHHHMQLKLLIVHQ